MIRVWVEIGSGEVASFKVEVRAKSIEQAVQVVRARYPDRMVRVAFPLDPQIFFGEGLILTSGTVLPEAPKREEGLNKSRRLPRGLVREVRSNSQ